MTIESVYRKHFPPGHLTFLACARSGALLLSRCDRLRLPSLTLWPALVRVRRPQKIVWHGATASGERNMDAYCDAWHSSAASKDGMASSLLDGRLLQQHKYACNNRFVVLCVEVATSRRRARRSVHELPDEGDALLTEDQYADMLLELDANAARH